MGLIIRNGIEYGGGSGNNNVIHITLEEYEALPDTKYSDNIIYLISDGSAPENIEFTDAATNIFYDNETSGLQVDNVQEAINEVYEQIDYIIEESYNSNGWYRKWKSGLMEQWFNKVVTASITNTYGSLYQGIYTWVFPKPFMTFQFGCCGKAQYDTGASWGVVYSFNETQMAIRMFDVISRPSAKTVEVLLYAKGRWK